MATPVKTRRGKCLRWHTNHKGLKEDPPGSNWDKRKDGIKAAIMRCGFNFPIPWCGAWVRAGLEAAGVQGLSSRQASVSLCEQDARSHKPPFSRGWVTTSTPQWWKKVLRGDSVVLYGQGVHIAAVRSTSWVWRKMGYIRTSEGNTSSGNAGSQSDGGMSTTRLRPISAIYGFCLTNYPGS